MLFYISFGLDCLILCVQKISQVKVGRGTGGSENQSALTKKSFILTELEVSRT